ncbi:hypothetical protein N9H39_11555 [Gammaproteobacteria bacterium]|nr:hypothetical protein [Gammaproteobacteria bacterium]
MFQMLTCFDLKPGVPLARFEQSLAEYTAYMHELDLVNSTGPIGLRQSDTIMDTDDKRKHQYFVIMYFRDRIQCDYAVDYIKAHKEPGNSIHKEVYSKVENQIFICWQDI